MSTDVAPIEATAATFWRAWSDRDAGQLTSLWDRLDSDCSYLAAESPARLVGFAAISDWFSATTAQFSIIRMRPKTIHPRRLTPDLGIVFAELDWLIDRKLWDAPIGGSIRISAAVRDRGEGWRLCHYAEAPLAPIVELRRFYQKVAADGHGSMG